MNKCPGSDKGLVHKDLQKNIRRCVESVFGHMGRGHSL